MLFDPPETSQPSLVGIAKLAAESPLIEAKQRVDYFEIETRSFVALLRHSDAFRLDRQPLPRLRVRLQNSLRPLRPRVMELRDPDQFERKIYAKRFHPAAFRAELSKVKSNESVWIGTPPILISPPSAATESPARSSKSSRKNAG